MLQLNKPSVSVIVIDHEYSRYVERLNNIKSSLVHADSLNKARALLQEFTPSLVILDPDMFQREGYGLLNELVSRNIPVILQGRTLEYSNFLYRGALDYFVKPLRFPVCIAVMKRWLNILEEMSTSGKSVEGLLAARKSILSGSEKPNIALVDDAIEDALAATTALKSKFNLSWFPNFDELKNAIEKGQVYDLILLDLYFRGERKGYEYLVELKGRSELSSVPIVMTSAQFAHKSVEMGLELGAADYIEKGIGTGIFNIDPITAKLMTHIADARYIGA